MLILGGGVELSMKTLNFTVKVNVQTNVKIQGHVSHDAVELFQTACPLNYENARNDKSG